ncbi:UNVERIFIED_CONTAM: hypothetical protein NCL1_48906 [Trichonephila clavipes]
MGNLTYAKDADMHYMYGHVNGNGKAALRMYHVQFPDRRMPDHRIFQLFKVTRFVTKSPRVAEQCHVNIHSLTQPNKWFLQYFNLESQGNATCLQCLRTYPLRQLMLDGFDRHHVAWLHTPPCL